MLEDLDLHSIADEQTRELVRRLLNVLEDVRADLRAAQAEIQRLRNEINRLKGEQGQPAIKPHTPQPPPQGPLFGTGTAHTESVVERPQDGPHPDRPGASSGRCSRGLAAGCG